MKCIFEQSNIQFTKEGIIFVCNGGSPCHLQIVGKSTKVHVKVRI